MAVKYGGQVRSAAEGSWEGRAVVVDGGLEARAAVVADGGRGSGGGMEELGNADAGGRHGGVGIMSSPFSSACGGLGVTGKEMSDTSRSAVEIATEGMVLPWWVESPRASEICKCLGEGDAGSTVEVCTPRIIGKLSLI